MKEFSYMDTVIIVCMIVAYIAFTSWLTVRLRSKNSEQFMTAERSMPAIVVGILLMSEFIGAKSTVGTAESAFKYGIAAHWSVLGAAIGYFLFGLFMVKRLYGSGEVTISGAIAQKYGKSTKYAVSIIMMYALLLVNVGNYISGAAALSTILKIHLPTAMCIIAVVSTFYYVFGGMKGAAYVTLLHSFLKYMGIAIILGVALTMTGGISPMVEKMPAFYFTWDGKIGASTVLAWVIGTVGAIFCTQFVVQAISSTKSAEDAKKATMYAALFCLPLGFALALIGVAAKYLFPQMNALYALPVFMQYMSPYLAGIVATSLVASVFVSVSMVALAIASLAIKDFYVPLYNPSPEKEFKMTRILSVIIGFIPLIFVFFVPEILKLSFFTRAIRLSISVVAMIAFYLPFFNSTRGANLGLLGSAVATSAWFMLDNPYGIDNMYIALISPAIIIAIEKLFCKKEVKAEANP
ncbi:sodium:solute symporter family protein [Sporomusa sp.]|uniref:sodium:solute symporter family protein n=1 Tax=Sporomusa sp. TaxID=2078658 RepID=UPI002C119DDE|nr:sodium:solute symporter family protein [Sporomusa sp.]HWR42085.1 sodium:solute symporter family protein [Sporomusa sp.]